MGKFRRDKEDQTGLSEEVGRNSRDVSDVDSLVADLMYRTMIVNGEYNSLSLTN